MEARAFFEDSPMSEVRVSATPREWRDVINDIIDMEPEDASRATLKLFDLLDGLGIV